MDRLVERPWWTPTPGLQKVGVRKIAKHYHKDTSKNLRCNERIRISPIRLIGENDEQVGVVETRDALNRAREAGLDLVEVAPQSSPPVCRIMDYGKWKYSQSKKERKSKAQRHETELKEIRIKTPKIGEHDLDLKVHHAREFLERGDRVQFGLRFRGRELAHIDEGQKIFNRIKEQLEDIAKVEQDFRREGRRITMMLAPGAKKSPPQKPAPKKSPATKAPPASPPPPEPAEQAGQADATPSGE